MQKWLVLSIWGHNHNHRTRTESFKSKWLTFGDHGQRKTRKKRFLSYIWVLSDNNQVSPVLHTNELSNISNAITYPDKLIDVTLDIWGKIITTISHTT